MDSLTTYYVARELDSRWRGRRVLGVVFERKARLVRFAVEGSVPVAVDLSSPDAEVREDAAAAPGPLLAGWRVVAVTAPVDERFVVIDLDKTGRFRGSAVKQARLVLSVIPAARGALLQDAGGRRLATLGSRIPDPTEPRPQLSPEEITRAAAAGEADTLLAGRWMSPRTAAWLIAQPERAAERYLTICRLPWPVETECRQELLPPPTCEPGFPISPPRADKESAQRAGDWRERALLRMREQLDRAGAAPRLREVANALTALGDAPAPPAVLLSDGKRVPVEASPGETAVQVAERLYRDVRSMERARESLPRRIAELERSPVTDEWPRRVARPQTQEGPGRGYRLYRSSGGLEIWVGRGAASNEAVTFRESSPSDVWLHARAAAGAHVILRWQKEESPPARDLEEAAMIAAWHSKARGSTVVPVDWTRRRYVRKPRGASPGKVVVSRAQTLFVRPAQELERKLRAER